MTELDSRDWWAFHRIGNSLPPHLSRQLTNHFGISGAESVLLVRLTQAKVKAINLHQLAIGLGWEISRMSHQMARMQENGLVKKVQSESDARCLAVSVTTKGKKIATTAIPHQSIEIIHCFSDVLTKQQLETLIEISDAVTTHMEEHHPYIRSKDENDALYCNPVKHSEVLNLCSRSGKLNSLVFIAAKSAGAWMIVDQGEPQEIFLPAVMGATLIPLLIAGTVASFIAKKSPGFLAKTATIGEFIGVVSVYVPITSADGTKTAIALFRATSSLPLFPLVKNVSLHPPDEL